MGVYETNHQIGMWGNCLNADSSQNTASSSMVDANVKLGGRVRDIKSVFYLVAPLLVDLLELYVGITVRRWSSYHNTTFEKI